MLQPIFISFNGNVIDASQPVLTSANRAFRYGDAVFETIRLMHGEILFFEKHLIRLRKSMNYLNMIWRDDFSFHNLYLLIRHLDQVNNLKGNGRIRLEVFRNDGGYYAPLSNEVSFLIEAESYSQKDYLINENGLKVDFFPEAKKQSGKLSNLKSSNSLCNVLAGIYKEKISVDDCIIFNAEGKIAEAINSNIFMTVKGELITPSLEQGCVAGVMRELIIEMVKEKGKKVIETKISAEDLLKADEVFLTNVIEGVKWVGAIRNKRYFNSYSRSLMNELNDLQTKKA